MSEITRRALVGASWAGAAAIAPLALTAAQAAPPKPPPAPVVPPSPWPDATAMAAAIKRGELSAPEAVETAIRRTETLQPILNFIVNSDFDRAMDKARAGRSGLPNSPFWGVPFLIKDLEDYVGLPTRFGSQAGRLQGPQTRQSPLMDAYDRAGLIVIGKSATPEAGFLPSTEPVATGLTHNPWDLARSSGGSSGGSAVAVASGVVTAGHATDGGGSIRIPASHCGLVGLKPSRARMAGSGPRQPITNFAAQHVLTRSVRDSAGLFAVGEDAGPHAAYPPVGLVEGPAKKRLRIGVMLANGLGHSPTADVVAANDHAAKLVAGLGHHVDYVRLPYDGGQFIDDFLVFWAAGALDLAENISKASGRKIDDTLFEPFTLGLVAMARTVPPAQQGAVLQRLGADALAYDTWFGAYQFDVVLSPVLSSGPPLLGEYGPRAPFDQLIAKLKEYVGYTPIHNIAGAPAVSLPLYWTEAGLPIGTMFAARQGQERMLFELAYELEQDAPWAHRIPPTHV